jgi:hypothetical protein
VLGGYSGAAAQSTVYYARLNADGSVYNTATAGGWGTGSALPSARYGLTANNANGVTYIIGGCTDAAGTCSTPISDVYYSNNGMILGSWVNTSVPQLPAAVGFHSTVLLNGQFYVIGGRSGGAPSSNVIHGAINGSNTIDSWQASSYRLPAARQGAAALTHNSYIYVLGGFDGSNPQGTVFRASGARTIVYGGLDLLGLTGQTGTDVDGAGSLTAGDTKVVGQLFVADLATFNNGLFVNGAISVQTPGTGGSVFSLNNVNTAYNVFDVKDLGTNFGGAVTSGAFIGKNSYFGDEFNAGHNTTCTVPSTAGNGVNSYARGDYGNSGSATACTAAGVNVGGGELNLSHVLGAAAGACVAQTVTGTNGVERLQDTGSATVASTENCVLNLAATTTTSNKIYNPTNLPVVTMKLKATTLQNSANDRIQVGMVSSDTANTLGTNSPTQSIYFTNCSTWNNAAAPTGCGQTTWYGVTSTTGVSAATVVTCSTGSGSLAANFSYLRIEVRGTSDVHFFADYNTSDGINESECGTGSTTNITSSGMTPWMQVMHLTNAATNNQLDIDYFRSWQDDNVAPADVPQDNPQTQIDESNPQTVAPISADSADPNIAGSFFNFLGATSEDTVINGNLFVHGTLYADKIKANQIEGLEIFTDQISSLQQKLADDGAAAAGSGPPTGSTLPLNLNIKGALTVGGPAEFHGNALFYKLVTFVEKAVFNNDVTFGGHIATAGGTPTFNMEAAAGLTSAPADNLATASIDGNDNAGQLTVVIGDNAAAGDLVSVKFGANFTKAPRVLITPANGTASQLHYYVMTTASGFKIIVTDAPSPGSTLNFNYLVVQ